MTKFEQQLVPKAGRKAYWGEAQKYLKRLIAFLSEDEPDLKKVYGRIAEIADETPESVKNWVDNFENGGQGSAYPECYKPTKETSAARKIFDYVETHCPIEEG